MELRIDPELREIIPALSTEERELLEESIRREGCRDALIHWNGVIVDGHNRFDICRKHSIPFRTESREFASRADAVAWMVANQLGRRNLTAEQASYLRGKRYQAEKREHGGTGANQHKQSYQNDSSAKTAVKLAEEYGVGQATIHRDAHFAKAVDTVAAKGGEQAKASVLSGKFTRDEVKELATEQPSVIQQKTAEATESSERLKLSGKDKKRRPRTAQSKKRFETSRTPEGGLLLDALKRMFLKADRAAQNEFVEWAVEHMAAEQ